MTLTETAPVSIEPRADRRMVRQAVPRHIAWHRLEAATVFFVALIIYMTGAVLIVFHLDALPTDSLARVASAAAAVASRDPHLAAIGFVWSPLPHLALLPLVALHSMFPALRNVGFAASIASAIAMAATVASLRKTLGAFNVPALPRLAVTGLFAASPMIALYGANGMSEAFLLWPLVTATRHLWLWLQNPRPQHLVWVGSALAVAYLCRYEALAAGVAACACVVATSWLRGRTERQRLGTAFVDGAIVAFPIGLAFITWAAVSWVIVGRPFEQFSSRYGNSAQVGASSELIRASTGFSFSYVLEQVTALGPTLVVTVVLAATAVLVTRSARPIVPLVVVAPVSIAQALIFAREASFGWLRFQIAVPLLTVLLVAALFGETRLRPRRPGLALVAAAAVLLAPSLVTSLEGLRDPRLSREEANIVRGLEGRTVEDPRALPARHRYTFERTIAREIDRLGLPEGAVLADNALAFPIVLASSRPEQWVITQDRDFEASLASPAVFRVRYLLTQGGSGAFDAVMSQYPELATSPEIASLERTFRDPETRRSWKLYRVAPLRPASQRSATVQARRAAGSGR